MFTETPIVEGEDKFIIITKNNKKIQGAACNRAIVKDNLTTRQIIAWLNGHIIIDTGVQQKIDNLSYLIMPPEASKLKVHNILEIHGHILQSKQILLSEGDNEYFCSCRKWRFYDKVNVTEFFLLHIDAVRQAKLI